MMLLYVAGARPNFMKIAPLIHESTRNSMDISWKLIHTGQHYDYEMSKVFFEELNIPEPDYFLDAGSGSHATQTAKIMVEFEKVCIKDRPDMVVVVGDVNSTLACSVTAKKMGIKVAHVEAGLRSGDMSMPEEINRIVTDSISDYLFVTEKSAIDNLKKEGKSDDQIFFVGNIMIDTLFYCLKKVSDNVNKKRVANGDYGVVTLHRPSNVDDKDKFEDILTALSEISRDMPLFFPVHPRTQKKIDEFRLNKIIADSNINIVPPLSYLNFLSLWRDAALVLTDSGGLQEETTALGVPCFTLRENTERPITVDEGTNSLVGTTSLDIMSAYGMFRKGVRKHGKIPELWDGKSAKRVLEIMSNLLRNGHLYIGGEKCEG